MADETKKRSAKATTGSRQVGLGERAAGVLQDAHDASEDDTETPDKLYFRIGEVSQLVGVDTHVLRYWESEFRMKPHRSNSGQRLYRKPDLSRFLRIKHLLHEEGYTIAGARKALAGANTSTAAADVSSLREALDRLNRLRQRIANLQQELRD